MLKIGLTGGIGAGKSAVSGRLATLGAVVIDADRIAREVVEPGTPALAEIADAFSTDVLDAEGALDRAALGRLVFADDAARARLNTIVHPRVAERTAELIAATDPAAIVVHDVPLLVENGLGPGYHLVLVVDAPADVRIERVTSSRGMAADDVRARIAAQATDERRRAAADVWLDNTGDHDQLGAAVERLWARRLVPYGRHLLVGETAPRNERVRLSSSDPSWPAQAERLVARLRHIAGDRALRVDHIGSTAVPELAAKDVIDLQLTVSDLVLADTLAEALGAGGFPVVASVTRDNPKTYEPDPERWRKRFHRNADPGRAVNLHLRVAGSPGWRYALLFRDWLRDDPAGRREYEALKYRVADAGLAADSYAEEKEPWFDAALPRAERWARTSGWAAPTVGALPNE